MSSSASSNALGTYQSRPWVRQYAPNVPPTLSCAVVSPLQAFDRCLEENPDAIALWYFNTPQTYLELDRQARRVQAHWSPLVSKGERVAIMNQNTPATLIALIAAWRLGAIVIPLSPMLTHWELLHYLEDGEPHAAMVGFAQAAAFLEAASKWGHPVDVIVARRHEHLLATDRPDLLKSLAIDPSEPEFQCRGFDELPTTGASMASESPNQFDIAFLTYTSGTTGKPKAARNTHANVCFSAEVYRVWLQLNREDVLLAAAPFSHITGLVAHIAAAWLTQIPLVMAYRFDPATMLSLIEQHGCTSTVAAITAYIALLDHPRFDPSKLRSFTKLFSGGAPVSASVVDRWETTTGVYIHNAYGLTETTSPTHLVPFGLRAPIDPESGVLSIGVPVPDTDCRIVELAEPDSAVATSIVGELLVRGPQLAMGYWRNAEETAQAFQNGWLRTGDLGRTDASGWFYIVDRAKDVIVASGFKVWPREVELALESHPWVKEAAVVGVPDSYRGETPKAFVILHEGAHAADEVLIAHCRERLAPYKVPRSIEVVKALPRNHAGKLLRRQLKVVAP